MNQHLSWDQISKCLIGDATPEEARHVRECPACGAVMLRAETSLADLRGSVHEWAVKPITSEVPEMNADLHLARLLTPASIEMPWYRTIIDGIRQAVNPPKLPPLEVSSRPVDPRELKGLSGLYAGNESRTFGTSILIHLTVLALVVSPVR